jgi:hypothetical protein
MNKFYDILLDQNKIGTTEFENSDAPMGIIFGKIIFNSADTGYNFFKKYCVENKVEFTDHPENRLISTPDIPGLAVFNLDGIEIKGLACSVSGMDSEGFEICIEGIEYPFYEHEFPHHVKAYNEMFKK